MEPSHPTPSEIEAVRRRAAELEQDTERLRRIAEHMKDRFRILTSVTHESVAIIDEGRLIDVSPEWEALFGYAHAEVMGKSVLDVVALESRDLVLHNVRTQYDEPYEALSSARTARASSPRSAEERWNTEGAPCG